MTTAHEIRLMFEEGLARNAERMADIQRRVCDPVFDSTLELLDQHFKRVARERYYLRHRLVRLLRRVLRQRVALGVFARCLARALRTPDRDWWSFRLHAGARASDWLPASAGRDVLHDLVIYGRSAWSVDLARLGDDQTVIWRSLSGRIFEHGPQSVELSQRPDIGRWEVFAENYGLQCSLDNSYKTTSPTPPRSPTGPHGGVSAFPHSPHHPIGGGGGWGWGKGEIPFARTCISLQLAKIFNVSNS